MEQRSGAQLVNVQLTNDAEHVLVVLQNIFLVVSFSDQE